VSKKHQISSKEYVKILKEMNYLCTDGVGWYVKDSNIIIVRSVKELSNSIKGACQNLKSKWKKLGKTVSNSYFKMFAFISFFVEKCNRQLYWKMPQNKRSNVSFVFLQLMWVRTCQEQSAVALWDPFCWKTSRIAW